MLEEDKFIGHLTKCLWWELEGVAVPDNDGINIYPRSIIPPPFEEVKNFDKWLISTDEEGPRPLQFFMRRETFLFLLQSIEEQYHL